MPNLYGDIVSDLTSGLIGGLGLLPSSNLGKDYAMFEAVHGSAPDIAGKHIANPTALLWSACMMLEYLSQDETAGKIRRAVDEVLNEGKHLTPDLHGTATTEEYWKNTAKLLLLSFNNHIKKLLLKLNATVFLLLADFYLLSSIKESACSAQYTLKIVIY